jgi:predicted nucleic acid-binding protein
MLDDVSRCTGVRLRAMENRESKQVMNQKVKYKRAAPVERLVSAAQAPECRDTFDLMFVHLAVAGKAKWLVTGCRDVLASVGQTKFTIRTSDGFASALEMS